MNKIEPLTAIVIAIIVLTLIFFVLRARKGKPMPLKIRFENIPCEIVFAIFDNADKGNKDKSVKWKIEPGDREIEHELPNDMTEPFRVVAPSRGWRVLDERVPINNPTEDILITGGAFFIDVDKPPENEEHNQKSIQNLITTVHGIEALSGRQKFFTALVSLQSHFEFLVYGMLVLSGHISNGCFKKLNNHEARATRAFSQGNTEFFSIEIEIIPGHTVEMATISDEARDQIEEIFKEIRTLRNKVVHKWGYKDVGRDTIVEIFQRIDENPGYQETDDAFYANAAWVMVRLYARANPISMQLNYFIQRAAVREDREERGYG